MKMLLEYAWNVVRVFVKKNAIMLSFPDFTRLFVLH